MSIEVEQIVNKIVQPVIKKTYVEVAKDGTNHIPDSIGLAKGDIIVFRGEGDPVRFSAGTASGKVMMTDPTSETGWVLGDGGGGGGGSSATAILHNSTGGIVLAGTVVKIDSGVNFAKAQAGDDDALFVVSEEVSDEEDVACYSIRNTVCLVRCDTGAVTVGDSLTISSTSGLLTKRTDTTDREVAVAMTAKASGNSGTVKALLSDVNPYAVLEIKDGGTGATTASSARENLGAASEVDLNKKILYFSGQTVSAVSSGELFRITDDRITTDTIVLECTFAQMGYLRSDVTWTSYSGYIAFTGTCDTATTANVTLGIKGV